MARREGSPLFRVTNHHSKGCGTPVPLDGDDQACYVGYFVNEHGEQACYTYRYATDEALLRLGDTGWGVAYTVVENGKAFVSRMGNAEELILTHSEQVWLVACELAISPFRAARRRRAEVASEQKQGVSAGRSETRQP